MFKQVPRAALMTLALVGTLTQSALAEDDRCLPLGGVGIANFFSEGDDEPMIISATLTGSVQSAAGKILAQRETPTGLEMKMEHYFQRADGGHVHTKDLGVLTAIPGRPGRYMIEITYEVQPEVSRGTLKGYSGTFRSFGIVDLRDQNDLKGLVRYSGQICQ